MTNAAAFALPHHSVVRHKTGKLYKVYNVGIADGSAWDGQGWTFTSNPWRVATLRVVGQRNGSDFGPTRSLKASDCTPVVAQPVEDLTSATREDLGYDFDYDQDGEL